MTKLLATLAAALQNADAGAFADALDGPGVIGKIDFQRLAMAAMITGQVEPLRALARHGFDLNAPLDPKARDHSFYNLIDHALFYDHCRNDRHLPMPRALNRKTSCVETLLAAGASPNPPIAEEHVESEPPPLYRATRWGDRKAMDRLIEAGADVNATFVDYIHENSPRFPCSALWRACVKAEKPRDLKIIETLLKAGADPDFRRDDQPLLVKFLTDANPSIEREIFNLLLAHGADIDAQYRPMLRNHHMTMLIHTVRNDVEDGVAFLLAAGANPNAKDQQNALSPLGWMVEDCSTNLPMMKRLVHAGASFFPEPEAPMFDRLLYVAQTRNAVFHIAPGSTAKNAIDLHRVLTDWEIGLFTSLCQRAAEGSLAPLMAGQGPSEERAEYLGFGLLPGILAIEARRSASPYLSANEAWNVLRSSLPLNRQARMDAIDRTEWAAAPLESHVARVESREPLVGRRR